MTRLTLLSFLLFLRVSSAAALEAGPEPRARVHLAVGTQSVGRIVGDRLCTWGKDAPYVPVCVSGYGDVVQIAGGDRHFCVLRQSGVIDCVERSTRVSSSGSVRIDLEAAEQLAGGSDSFCAVTRSGRVACWGEEYMYHSDSFVGDSVDEAQHAQAYHDPFRIPRIARATSVALGNGEFACARIADGSVRCFGYGPRAGFGTNDDGYGVIQAVSRPIGLTSVVQIAVEGYSRCALLADGSVRCWGARDFVRHVAVPTEIAGMTRMVFIAMKEDRVCGGRVDGSVFCANFGGPSGSLFGRPPYGPSMPFGEWSETAIRVAEYANARELVLGYTTCIVDSENATRCHGVDLGMLGEAPTPETLLEVPGVRATWLTASERAICAGGATGVFCWDDAEPYPLALPNPEQIKAVIPLGHTGGCALRGQRVECFDVLRSPSNARVLPLESVVQIVGVRTNAADGEEALCARLRDGQLACVLLSTGQTEVLPITGASDIFVAGGLSDEFCAVRATEPHVICSQLRAERAQGGGRTGRVFVAPASSRTASNVVESTPRCDRSARRVRCVDGERVYRNPPMVALEGEYDEIAGVDSFTCGRTGGRARCFSDASDEAHAAYVPGLTDAVAIVARSRAVAAPRQKNMCALRENGAVACWVEPGQSGLGRVPRWVASPMRTVALPPQ